MKIVTKTTVTTVRRVEFDNIAEFLAFTDLLVQYQTLDKHQHCFYCGIATPDQTVRTRDHVIPRVLGGRHKVNACKPCNKAKGSMLLDEFRAKRYHNKPIEFYGETVVRRWKSNLGKVVSL